MFTLPTTCSRPHLLPRFRSSTRTRVFNCNDWIVTALLKGTLTIERFAVMDIRVRAAATWMLIHCSRASNEIDFSLKRLFCPYMSQDMEPASLKKMREREMKAIQDNMTLGHTEVRHCQTAVSRSRRLFPTHLLFHHSILSTPSGNVQRK